MPGTRRSRKARKARTARMRSSADRQNAKDRKLLGILPKAEQEAAFAKWKAEQDAKTTEAVTPT
jgi:hypothetical protein